MVCSDEETTWQLGSERMANIIRWNGKVVQAKVIRATKLGINSVMSDCAKTAKAQHPPIVRTSTYQTSIQIRNAVEEANRIVGLWGAWNVNYAVHLEFKKFSRVGLLSPLRNAADQHYGELPSRIRSFM